MSNVRNQLTTTLTQFYNQPVARVSLELFLSLGTVMFFALFAIRPTLLTMSDLVKEIQDKRALDGQLGQKIAALYSAQSEYLTLENQLPLLDEAIPSSPQLVPAIKMIEKLASDRSLVISTLSVPTIPPENEVPLSKTPPQRQILALSFTISGDYPTIRTFVEDLKSMRRLFIIESVAFSTSEEKGTKKLKAQITVGLPYYGTKQ